MTESAPLNLEGSSEAEDPQEKPDNSKTIDETALVTQEGKMSVEGVTEEQAASPHDAEGEAGEQSGEGEMVMKGHGAPGCGNIKQVAANMASGTATVSAHGQAVPVGFSLVEKTGDLFAGASGADGAMPSLAHCVSVDLRMGSGIAKLFRSKFGRVPELVKQGPRVGGVVHLKLAEGRYVYYLTTKRHYNDKPTYDSLRASLRAMRAHCEASGVARLAMPRIGCGLDKLEWTRVRRMIEEVFAATNISIVVYSI